MEPNKEAITKWVEALESEEFEERQVRGVIATDDGRVCAIGVRNMLYLRLHGFAQPSRDQIKVVNQGAANWVGISDWDLVGEAEDGVPFNVVKANDVLHFSFREIAQHLRKRYL